MGHAPADSFRQPRASLRARFRLRRRARGAAAVEAAVIAAAMVVIFACMWAAVNFERAKLSAMNEARVEAWSAALQPCDGSESTLGDISNETSSADADPLPNTSQTDKFADIGKTSLATDSGYVDVTRSQKTTFPGVIGGQTFEMRSHMYIRCNEPHPPENAVDFFKTAFSVLKSTIGF